MSSLRKPRLLTRTATGGLGSACFSRRDAIKKAAGATLSFVGCLAREPRQPEAEWIDLHTHLFNVLYLPIEGIAARWCTWKKIDPEVGRAVARVLKRLALRQQLDEIEGAEQFAKTSDETEIEALIRETPEDVLLEENLGPAMRIIDPTSPEGRVASKADFRRIVEEFTNARPAELFDTAFGFVRWIRLMIRDEEKILAMLEKASGRGRFVHHLMDMENYWSDRAEYSVAKQIVRMRTLMDAHTGKLIGFVAWDPKREDRLKIVMDAIASGYRGVKFYPPNGYRPVGNEELSGSAGKMIDDANDELFLYCASKNIPILTHCTPSGFESQPKFGCYSDPVHWRRVLEVHRGLRLCFGHAGGEEWWFKKRPSRCNGASFGESVVDLCVREENVYLEVGHLNAVFDREARRRIVRRLLTTLKNHPKLAKRICFGSDWHMPEMFVGGPGAYRQVWREIFRHPDLEPHEEDFFRGNALRLLASTGGSPEPALRGR